MTDDPINPPATEPTTAAGQVDSVAAAAAKEAAEKAEAAQQMSRINLFKTLGFAMCSEDAATSVRREAARMAQDLSGMQKQARGEDAKWLKAEVRYQQMIQRGAQFLVDYHSGKISRSTRDLDELGVRGVRLALALASAQDASA